MSKGPGPTLLLVIVALVATSGEWVAAGQNERFLGYEIGEERRYVLGPEESLVRGELGFWSIRLEEVYADTTGRPEGVFALVHRWQAPQPFATPPLYAIMRVESEGTVRVNAHGFPRMIRYETVRHLAGVGEQAYTIDYEIDDDNRRYRKRTTLDGNRWYQDVPIRGHDSIDRRAAAGLFAFLPTVPGCLDRRVSTYQGQGAVTPQPRSASSQPGTQLTPPSTIRAMDNTDCEETLFANPGLLALAMPALWEAKGQREYVFFTPIGPVGEPTSGVGVGVPGQPYGPGSGIVPPGARPGGMGLPPSMARLEPDPMTSATYHEIEALRFVERVSVRVGSRTRDAWLVEMSHEVGPLYLDDEGGVLRVDLPPVPGSPERFIRMLWASEF